MPKNFDSSKYPIPSNVKPYTEEEFQEISAWLEKLLTFSDTDVAREVVSYIQFTASRRIAQHAIGKLEMTVEESTRAVLLVHRAAEVLSLLK